MAQMKEYSFETIVPQGSLMGLKEAGNSVKEITEQLAASRTSQAQLKVVQAGREL